LAVSSVQLPEDIEFLVINPKAHHTLSDSPYNERRSCCEQAAGQLAELLPHPVKSLRDVSVEEFELYKNRIDPHSAKRAAHVIGEINRVETGINLLGKGAIAEFGELLFQSHQSSIENFENSCPELDIVVSAARDAGALGARLSGGGFGGCVIAMLHAADAKADGEKIKKFCQSRGIKPELIEVTPSAGAQLIPKIKWQSISSLTPVRI
jgi:galactokinase